MTKRRSAWIASICLMLLFLPAASFSQDTAAPRPARERKGRLRLVVTGGSNPLKGADVIVRSGDGEFSENTNTNAQGAANMANVPFGLIIVQVTAQGWKTSGRQYEFKEGGSIQVNLERDQRERLPEASPTPTPNVEQTTSWVQHFANKLRSPWRPRRRRPGH